MRKYWRRSAVQVVAFVFATRIVQSLFFLNPAFHSSVSLQGGKVVSFFKKKEDWTSGT